ARYKGVRALEPGYAITVADLEGTAAAQKVEVKRGDLLLVRTGHMTRYLDKNDWRGYDLDNFPGVSATARSGSTRPQNWPGRSRASRSCPDSASCGRRKRWRSSAATCCSFAPAT